jgi:hypothetical protein
MTKVNVVESIRYSINRDSGILERNPHKMFRISVSSVECNRTMIDALEVLIKDLVDVVRDTPRG